MFNSILISTILFVSTYATEFSECPNLPSPTEVRLEGCDKQPCIVVKGKPVTFEVDFISGFTAKNLYTDVRVTFFDITVAYPLADAQKYACTMFLHGSHCPIYKGEVVTYKYIFEFPTYYPDISFPIEISLKDDQGETATCFKTEIQPVKE